MNYDELDQLFGVYYHEDFEDVWPAFGLYLSESTNANIATLIREIDHFLQNTSTSDVAKETWRLGSYVYLGDEPGPYVEWLEEMRRRAEKAVGAAAPR